MQGAVAHDGVPETPTQRLGLVLNAYALADVMITMQEEATSGYKDITE